MRIRSEFEIPVDILSIHSTDSRVMPIIKRNVLDPHSEDVILELVFDPHMSQSD